MVLPLPGSFWELVERGAAARPDARMLLDEEGRCLRFGEFPRVAEQVAAGLAAGGIAPGDRVSWVLPTGLEACVLMAALSRLGCVQNPIVPILGEREVRFITEQTGAQHLIVAGKRRTDGGDRDAKGNGAFAAIAAELGFALLSLDAVGPGSHGLRLPFADPADLPEAAESATGVRWIYYTSGTTADPKGARHTDASILACSNAFAQSGWYREDDLAVVPIPVAHVGGVMLLEVCLRTGCAAALVQAFDPVKTPRFAADLDATILVGNGAVFQAYLEAQRAVGPAALLPRLRVAANGGSSRPDSIHDTIRRDLGGAGTMSGWGLTECPAPTAGRIDDTSDQLALTEGRPAEGVEVVSVDASGRTQAPGVEGELRLRAPQLFQGYVDSSLDAGAFDESGRLRTGDLGVVEATGHVRITGRLKDVIIRNGENISALEIEQALGKVPGVADVAVIGLPDERTGERCCAVIQTRDQVAPLSLERVAEHLRELGISRRKWPEQLERVEHIPRDGLGKIDKRALRRRIVGSASSDHVENDTQRRESR